MIGLFGTWDYVVLLLVLLISSGIGVYYRFTGGKQKTVQEYLLADKNMPVMPVAFSLMASFMSSITLLGVSSENYTFGLQFIVINISYGIFTPIAAYLYLPVFFRLQATSAYEYLEKRFGNACRLAASLVYTTQMVLYMGVALYAPAIALEAVTGISQLAAILSVGIVCTFYSTIGGMKAVLMTDVFQSLLMFAAVFSIIICASMDVGIDGIWELATQGRRTELLNFSIDPTERHSWFTLIIGGGVTFLSLYAVNQTQVQRYLTVKSLKSAQTALWLNWPILTLLSLSTSFAGLAIYSKYHDCDPVCAKQIKNRDQLMPYYVIDTMGHIPGLAGLFVAGIFSAALSSISASLNSLAAVTIEDYYKPLYKKIWKTDLPDKAINIRTKFIALSYGIVSIAVAFMAQFLGGVLQASLTIFGVIGGPLLGLFSLGMFTTTANQKGALTGLISGISIALWMAYGEPKPKDKILPMTVMGCPDYLNATATCMPEYQDDGEYFWLYRVSYLYRGVMGLIVTCVVGYLSSYIVNQICGAQDPATMDSNLFIPPLARKLEKQYDKNLKMHETKIATISKEEDNFNHRGQIVDFPDG